MSKKRLRKIALSQTGNTFTMIKSQRTKHASTTLATATAVSVGLALLLGGSPVGAATKRTTKKTATTTTVKRRPARSTSKPTPAHPVTTVSSKESPATETTLTGAPDTETTLTSSAPTTTRNGGEPARTEPPKTEPQRTEPPKTEPKRTEPPKTEPPKTEPPKTEPQRTEPPRTLPTVPQPPKTEPQRTEPPRTDPPRTDPPRTLPTTPQPPTSQPSTEIRTASTLGLRCSVVERSVRCEWSGDANGGVRYLLLRGHAGDAAGRVIGPFEMSVHAATDVTPPSKLTFTYLVIAQDASGKNTAHSDPVSVTIP